MSTRLMNQTLGALTEAWEEIRINRSRVILSLIGVAASVWAMGSVMALGSMIFATFNSRDATWAGIPGTIPFSMTVKSDGDGSGPEPEPTAPSLDADGRVVNPLGDAAKRLAEQTHATLWSRHATVTTQIQAPGVVDCSDHDDSQWSPEDPCSGGTPTFEGVDEGYAALYTREAIAGRWLTERDADLQANPVVVNESMWKLLGSPDLSQYPRFALQGQQGIAFTVVGITQNVYVGDSPTAYLSYDTLFRVFPPALLTEASRYQRFSIAAPPDEAREAVEVLTTALTAQVPENIEVSADYNADQADQRSGVLNQVRLVIGGIGAIVILIGALGLLTVSIVTIKQRVREIGIRRSMGASAKRVFFAVFLESVVATTTAGFFGIILSILTVRLAPYHLIDAPDLSTTPYPISAALIGLGIAAFVGALCGIIPAIYAVRIKPIDAIRF